VSRVVIYVEVDETALQHYRESFDFTNMPKGWLETYENMNEFERSRWFLERFKSLSNHLYLAGFVSE
jgi:hypothetical protein